MTAPSPFTKALRQVMTRQALTPSSLAAKLGLPVRSVSPVVTGKRRPPELLDPWLAALGCTPTERQRLLDTAALSYLPPAFQPRFQTLIDDSAQLRDIRGTMVLADQLFLDIMTGKWVIAGTYARWYTTEDELHVHNVQCYLRLQVERPGTYPGKVWCVDRTQPPNHGKIWELDLPLVIPEQGLPVFEARLILPGMRVRCPVARSKRKAGEAYAMQTTLWLRVGNTEVASCPLDFIFTPPPAGDSPHAHDHDPAPERQ